MNYQFGLIGYPAKHSLSPWIHECFLQKANLNGSYSIIEIPPDENFDEQIDHLKSLELHGFNVTVPYKQRIISYLDELDEQARKMGAVNTVVSRNGKWVGYNTDGIGYLRSLTDRFPSLLEEKTKRILLIGAGGAARGIYYVLAAADYSNIDVANRTKASAEGIASLKRSEANTNVLSLKEAEQQLDEYDVIIQTTSVGMKPYHSVSIIETSKLKSESIVSDIIYQPLKTELLRQAEAKGASVHLGHTMLLHQAQYAFEIWTDNRISVGDMDEQLQHKLEGR